MTHLDTTTEAAPTHPGARDVVVLDVHQHDAATGPLFAGLAREYWSRYGHHASESEQLQELLVYPAAEFAAPEGAFLVLQRDGRSIAGGALRRRLEPELGLSAHTEIAAEDRGIRTAELKRIWASAEHRRQGLASRVVQELEARARRAGYQRVYVTTGPRQPEAVGVYLANGYRPLFDVERPGDGARPFEKSLHP